MKLLLATLSFLTFGTTVGTLENVLSTNLSKINKAFISLCTNKILFVHNEIKALN